MSEKTKSTRTESAASAAMMLGVHERTLRQWCNRESIPCPHDRAERNSIFVDLVEVEAWMRRTGTKAGAGRRPHHVVARAKRANDGFWNHRDERPPIDIPMAAPGIVANDLSLFDGALVSETEQQIITGTRTLDRDETIQLVKLFARFRANVYQDCISVSGWLTGQSVEEIEARLRCIISERLEWIGGHFRHFADTQDGIERDDDGEIIARGKKIRARLQKEQTTFTQQIEPRIDGMFAAAAAQSNNNRP